MTVRRFRSRERSVLVLVAAALLSLVSAAGAGAGADARRSGPQLYRPPVDAPVADPFRPPPEPWLPGNRGIEYRTVPGTSVVAIGPGRVAFAGWVAGQRVVTVDHPDGLRSSYLPLAWIGVSVGDRVAAGDRIGRSGDRLHLGVRRGDRYLDPASLWGQAAGGGRVRLVPLDDKDSEAAGAGHRAPAPGNRRSPRLAPADLAGPALGLVVAGVVVHGLPVAHLAPP